MKFSSLNKFR